MSPFIDTASVVLLKVNPSSPPNEPPSLNWTVVLSPATFPAPPPPADVCAVPSANTILSTPPILKFLSVEPLISYVSKFLS